MIGTLWIQIEDNIKFILTAAELESISTGFAIGFGSFVDKNILPFALNSYKR